MTTYNTLLSDLVSYSARTDVTAQVPLFLRLAEPEIFRRVKLLDMETDGTLTFESANDYADDLPIGYLGFRSIFISGASNPEAIYMPPHRFHVEDNLPTDAFSDVSADYIYTIESNKVKLKSIAGATEDVTADIVYFLKPSGVTSVNTTNVILTNHYDIYFLRALAELWDWVDEKEVAAAYIARFEKVVEQVLAHENERRRPSGPLVRRPPNRRVV